MNKMLIAAAITGVLGGRAQAQTALAGSDTPVLEKITVIGILDRGETTTATKTPTDSMDTPMSIQLVTRDVIDAQQAIRPRDALKNVSGVQPDFGFGGLRDRAIIRGFSTDDFPQGGSYLDGVLQFEATNSLANVERVEVLKGVAAMLFGRIEPGGLINYVTKRPQDEAHYSLQQQASSHDEYRTTLDATGALAPPSIHQELRTQLHA